jgi:hypothetical protein
MEIVEQPYYQELGAISYEEQHDEIEYSKLKKCIGIVIAVSFISALIYFFRATRYLREFPLF